MTLYNNEARFINAYFRDHPGYYLTGDAAYKDERGNIYIVSRTDDIINVAAHRLSTSSMEGNFSLLISRGSFFPSRCCRMCSHWCK